METFWRDITFGARVLVKSPAFAAIAIFVTALGIGANTAIFSVVNSVLLRPLPFPDSERIVVLEGVNPQSGIKRSNMSAPDFADWQAQAGAFERLAAFSSGGSLPVSNDEPERVRATAATGDFFPLLGTNPLLGRTLQPDDAKKDGEPVAVLGHGLWQRRFGGDPSVVGSRITLGSKATTVVGVMPPGFDYPAQAEVWLPLALDPVAGRRDNRSLEVVGRLRAGVTEAEAQSQLDAINGRLALSYRETNTGWNTRLTNLREWMVGGLRTTLLVLLGAVAFVLLIACANVASLLLARATARRREIAVRTALGATRARIVRQLLTESFLLSLAGGALGLLLSVWLTDLFVAVSPADSPRFDEIRPDARVFGFTLLVTLLTGLFFGLAPALQASRPDLNEVLKEGGRTGASGARHNRVRGLLVVAEIAISFMLLASAGLLVRSFMRLRDVSPGFDHAGVLALRVSLQSAKYPEGARKSEFYRQALDRIGSLPGVEAAGGVLTLPLGGDTFSVGRAFIREGRPMTPEESAAAAYLVATPGYFRALRVPVLAGRDITASDTENSPMVVVVNETMARQFWGGESPVGKRITIWRDEKFAREVVGVVGDTRGSLDAPAGPQMYVPYAQDANWNSLSIVVRSAVEPSALTAAVRGEIRALDKTLPVWNVRTMDEVLAASMAQRRSSMLLFGAFALLALLLALVGIYGVTAFYVTQRTHEIGVRMALGAQRRDVLRLVLGQSLRLTLGGLALGLAGGLLLSRVLSGLLYEVKPTDPATFAAGALALAVVATLACYLPARRATKVDPLVALRYE